MVLEEICMEITIMFISISKAAKLLGVCVNTLGNWEIQGIVKPSHRTPGGHRRFLEAQVRGFCSDHNLEIDPKINLCYARVSSHDQKEDLKRQLSSLELYCQVKEFGNTESITDLGSGLKMDKPGLKKLIRLILDEKVIKTDFISQR